MKVTPKVDPADLWFDHSKIPKHHVDVHLEFGKLAPVLGWCEETCADNYRYTSLNDEQGYSAGYRFYFKSKKDLLLFELKWV